MLPRPVSMPKASVLTAPTHMLGVIVMLACHFRHIAHMNSLSNTTSRDCVLDAPGARPQTQRLRSIGCEGLVRTHSMSHSEWRHIAIITSSSESQ